MRMAPRRPPQLAHDFEAFFENLLIVLEGNMERQIFAPVVTAAAGEIDAPAGQKVERRPLLGDADRMMQRQHVDSRREAQPRGIGGDISQHHVRTRQHAERVEMMFADPGRMHADLLGVQRLGGDVGDEMVRGACVVFVVIVAQREIAEIHRYLPYLSLPKPRAWLPYFAFMIVDITSVVNAIICAKLLKLAAESW